MVHSQAYGHHGRVFDITFAPSSSKLATASEDGTARVWTEQDGVFEQASCLNHSRSAEVMRVSWRHDEQLLATGGADKVVKVWRPGDGYQATCTAVLSGHDEEVYSARWRSPSTGCSEHMITVSGSRAHLWDLGADQPTKLTSTQLQSSSFYSEIPELWRSTTAFGAAEANGKSIAACPCSDGNVHIMSLHGGKLQPLLVLNVAADVKAAMMCVGAAFRSDGEELAVALSDGVVQIYDTRMWEPICRYVSGTLMPDIAWQHAGNKEYLWMVSGGSLTRLDTDAGTVQCVNSAFPGRTFLTLDLDADAARVAASGNTIAAPSSGSGASSSRNSGSSGGLMAAPRRRRASSLDASASASQRAPIEVWTLPDELVDAPGSS